jgi:hypothetical protein
MALLQFVCRRAIHFIENMVYGYNYDKEDIVVVKERKI